MFHRQSHRLFQIQYSKRLSSSINTNFDERCSNKYSNIVSQTLMVLSWYHPVKQYSSFLLDCSSFLSPTATDCSVLRFVTNWDASGQKPSYCSNTLIHLGLMPVPCTVHQKNLFRLITVHIGNSPVDKFLEETPAALSEMHSYWYSAIEPFQIRLK